MKSLETVLEQRIPELVVSISEATSLEAYFQLLNWKSLIESGLVEGEGDQDLVNFLNQYLLLALGLPPRFFLVHAHQLGQPHCDSSPGFCKLDLIQKYIAM